MTFKAAFFALALCFTARLISVNTQVTSIEDTWSDTNADWTDTNKYINGDLTIYHGWFPGEFNNVTWYRVFSCAHYSTVTVEFTCFYGCGVETGSGDGCRLYFNDPIHSTIALEKQYVAGESIDLTGDESQQFQCGAGMIHSGQGANIWNFSSTAASYTDTGLYFLPNQEFEVAFATTSSIQDINDEYLAISYISVICNQVITPSPTYNPSIGLIMLFIFTIVRTAIF